MIRIENIQTYGFESAIRAMRMPVMSHAKSDSGYSVDTGRYIIGEKDMKLMQTLHKGGAPHEKFMRQIGVSMTITAPCYWWAEFDTYKVGVTRNSSSFMHKGLDKPFTLADFSTDAMDDIITETFQRDTLTMLNNMREMYLARRDNTLFRAIRQYLPSSYNYTCEVTANYAVIANMIKWRKDHRLQEWQTFCKVMLHELPYLGGIINVNC